MTIHAEKYKDTYNIDPRAKTWSKHPLIEASFKVFELPKTSTLMLDFSEAPMGASTGTSASVSVALLGALDLISESKMMGHEITRKSHHIETEILGYQSGIQDQLSSAYGGINFIEMRNYPEASSSPTRIPEIPYCVQFSCTMDQNRTDQENCLYYQRVLKTYKQFTLYCTKISSTFH